MPIVSTMSDEITNTSQWVNSFRNQFTAVYGDQRLDFEVLRCRLSDLSVVCRADQNFSIDTYAKKLMHKGMTLKYEQLKRDITFYFLLQQKRKGVDLRYDNFWASILNAPKLTSNVKILSWNYDYQLELGYQDFIKNDFLSETSSVLQIKNPSDNLMQNLGDQF